MEKKINKHQKEILELIEKGQYFQYEVKDDNFLNDNYEFLDKHDLKLVYNFADLILRNYVIRMEDENRFMYNDIKKIMDKKSEKLVVLEKSPEPKKFSKEIIRDKIGYLFDDNMFDGIDEMSMMQESESKGVDHLKAKIIKFKR